MILLTGATGFTGGFVLDELLRRGLSVRCFVRRTSDRTCFEGKRCEVFEGDIHSSADWDRALIGIQGIINVVSFKEGHIATLIASCEKADIHRALFISTTAIFTFLNAASKEMRASTEQMIISSKLDWCILRPTMIYGNSRDRNISRLIRAVNNFPLHPILGNGTNLMQPIYVQDLAMAVVKAFVSPVAVRKAYNLAGETALTYRQCVLIVASILGKRTILLPMPIWLALLAVTVCSFLPFMPKLKREQVRRLNEDKVFSYDEAARDFGFAPLSFKEGVAKEVRDILQRP